jgi:hypothetical protein
MLSKQTLGDGCGFGGSVWAVISHALSPWHVAIPDGQTLSVAVFLSSSSSSFFNIHKNSLETSLYRTYFVPGPLARVYKPKTPPCRLAACIPGPLRGATYL